MAAPSVFSMIENPEDTIRFLERLRQCVNRGCRPRIDASGVKRLTPDAIVLLRSRLRPGASYWGNLPLDPSANLLWRESGFLDHVNGNNIVPAEPHGSLRKATSATTEVDDARQLIRVVTQGLFGQPLRSPGSYRTLVECMNNTLNWAGVGEKWWALSHYDLVERRGTFAFADNGIGILKSANISKMLRSLMDAGLRSKTAIVQGLFDGTVRSASNRSNRGFGLPSMKKAAQAGRIRNLRVVSNNVYANISADEYRTMKVSLTGTLVYWELGDTL